MISFVFDCFVLVCFVFGLFCVWLCVFRVLFVSFCFVLGFACFVFGLFRDWFVSCLPLFHSLYSCLNSVYRLAIVLRIMMIACSVEPRPAETQELR